jgi:pSer/pThr/pTyr-binding forkhead associated (FHA) protein
MAYGRLDIYFPDGAYKTYPLSAARISLGRSAENTLHIENPTIAPTHLYFLYQDGQTSVRDDASLGGTFVDGERIKTGQPHLLYGGEEILIGDLRLIFHFLDDAPTRPVTVPEEVTQRIEVVAPNFAVDVVGPDQAVAPGAHIAAQLTIHNTGSKQERYSVDVSGIPRDWVRLDRSEVEIAPGKTEDILINFKPTRRPESQPGRYRVVITTRPRSTPDALLNCEVSLHILPFGGFGMALEDARLAAGEPFKLYLHNQGNAPLVLSLSARERQHQLRFSLPAQPITLAAGQRMIVQGTAQQRRMFLVGSPRHVPFDLLVQARDASGFLAVVRAYAAIKPSIPAWAIPAAFIAVAGLLLVALALLGRILSAPPPAPQIISFGTSSERVTQGQQITLNWEAEDAETMTLLVNGSMIAEGIDPDAGSLAVDTSAFAGAVLLTLRASSDGGVDEVSRALEIIAPLAITYFNVEPQQLVRYVVQTLTLNWSVSGAVSTQLRGLEGFSQSPLAESYGASGTIAVAGVPILPITLQLGAQDSSGARLEETFILEVIDPRCTPSVRSLPLYALPEAGGTPIATLAQGSTVTVDAQDASGAWLRVLLNGGQVWGQRAGFVCEPTFDPADLRKDITLPTQPMPTATSPLPPTASQPTLPTPIAPTATGRFGG